MYYWTNMLQHKKRNTNLAVTALLLVKRYHSRRNDLYSMSLSSSLFKLSRCNAFIEEEEFDFSVQTENTKHPKWNWAGFCYIKGRTISIGAYQQIREAPPSVDHGSERPDGDSQLEIFPIARSSESDNSDRLSFLTFTPLRSPVSSQNNSENICFVPPYTSWVVCFGLVFLCVGITDVVISHSAEDKVPLSL